MREIRFLLVLLMLLGLVACGGGETGSSAFSVNVTPANNAIDVDIDANIVATFSHEIRVDTINSDTFKLVDEDELSLAGDLTIDGAVVTFDPKEALEYNRSYTAKISREVTSASVGNLPTNFSYSFKTKSILDNAAPNVVSTYPVAEANGVPLNISVTITFNEPVKATSLAGISFVEIDQANGKTNATIPFRITYTHGKTVTVTPSNGALKDSVQYAVKLKDIKDDAGNVLADFSWTFVTGNELDNLKPVVVQTLPTSDAAGIPVTRNISVKFSEAMDTNSITNKQFTLTEVATGNAVIGTVSYVDKIATFSVKESGGLLKNDTEYEVRLSDIKDLAGNTIEPFQSFFTTAAKENVAPEVAIVEFQQLENKSGVAPTTNIIITFSEGLYPPSVNNDTIKVDVGVNGSVSLIDTNSVVFTPASRLTEKMSYTLVVAANVLDESLNPMTKVFTKTFTTGDLTPPEVKKLTSRDTAEFPQSASVDQAINTVMSLTFNELLSDSNKENFLVVSANAIPVSGLVDVNGNEVKFTPTNDLPQNTKIDVTANTNIKDFWGNTLAQKYSWSFTTGDFSAPEPVTNVPANNQTLVDITNNIIVNFGETELISPASVTNATYVLRIAESGEQVPATVSVEKNKIILNPNSSLAEKTQYQVEVSGEITDIANHKINAPLSWVFTTQDITAPVVTSTSPEANATGIIVGKQIVVDFSEEINTTTINASSFYLKDKNTGAVITSSIVIEDDKQARLIPAVNLQEQTSYLVYLTSAIKDLYDNSLKAYEFTFKVGDFTAPRATINAIATDELSRISTTPVIIVDFTESMSGEDTAFSVLEKITKTAAVLDVTWLNNNTRAQISLAQGLLTEQTEYVFAIDHNALNDGSNNLLAVDPLSFAVGDFTNPNATVAPIAIDELGRISKTPTIIIDFDEPVVAENSVFVLELAPRGSGQLISLTSQWNELNTQASLTLSSGELIEQTEYVVYLFNENVTDITGNVLNPVAQVNFVTGDFISPVASILPLDVDSKNRTPTNPVWRVNFSESVQGDDTAFSLTSVSGGDAIGLVKVWNEQRTQVALSLASNQLEEQGSYTFAINNALLSDGYNLLLPIAPMIFKVGDFSDPTAVILSPAFDAQNRVSKTPVWTVKFSEPVIANAQAFALEQTPIGSGLLVPVNVNWNADASIATLSVKSGSLIEQSSYVVTVSSELVTDHTLNNLKPVAPLSFTVGDFTAPQVTNDYAPKQIDSPVGINSQIVVPFNELIDVETLSNSSITLSPAVPGVISVNNSVLSFDPDQDLASSTKYTVTVSSQIKDLAGNALGTDFAWEFTTGDFIGPQASITPPSVDSFNRISKTPMWRVTFTEEVAPLSDSAFKLHKLLDGVQVSSLTLTKISPREFDVSLSTGQLDDDTAYVASVDYTQITDLSNNKLSPVSSIQFTVGDFTNPVATINLPTTDDLGRISRKPTWTVSFNESIQGDDSAFSLTTDSGVVTPLTIKWNNDKTQSTVSVKSGQLIEQVEYFFSIDHTKLSDGANNLAPVQRVSFTVGDFTRPSATIVPPVKDSLGRVSTTPVWSVSFNEQVKPNDAAFTLKLDGSSVALSVVWSAENTLATFSLLTGSLAEEKTYEFSVDDALIKDVTGNPLNFVSSLYFIVGDFTFPTVINIAPGNNAISKIVPVDSSIVITFSESMNTTLVESALSITPTIGNNAKSWSNNNTVLTINPSTNLTGDALYQVNIAGTAQDLVGNLLSVYSSQFRTVDNVSPTVLDIVPVNDQTSKVVAVNSNIVITFSEGMNTTSVESALSITPTIGNNAKTWSNNNTVLTVNPDVNLTGDALYQVNIAGTAQDLMGNILSVYSSQFHTVDNVSPTVVDIAPANDAISKVVAVNSKIVITFSEGMNTSSVESALSITPTIGNSPKTWSNNKTVLTINPSGNLTGDALYQVNIAGTAQDLAGNLLSVYSSQFRTVDNTSPTVLNIAPANDAISKVVAVNSNIVITFSESMNTTSVESSLSITPTIGNNAKNWSNNNTVLTINPDANLTGDALYQVSIVASTAQDLAGNFLAEYISQFRTVDNVPPTVVDIAPVNDAISKVVAVNSNIVITFSEGMNTTSVESALSITPTIGNNAKNWSNNNTVLTINPDANLAGDALYQVSIVAGTAQDLVGNFLAVYSSQFHTVDNIAPSLVSTSPVDGGVALSGTITINFSEPINTSGFEFTLKLAGSEVVTTKVTSQTPISSVSYSIDSGLVANGLYIASIVGTITDASNVSTNIDRSWQFSSGSLKVVPNSGSGKVLLNETITDPISSALYVVTGLALASDYALKLEEKNGGTGLSIEVYNDAFSSLKCVSDSGLANELCLAKSNNSGELYLKVTNASGDPSFDLTLKVSTSSGVNVADKSYDYKTLSNLVTGKSYDINLSGLDNLDLYVFSGSLNGSTLSAVCRSATGSTSESCSIAGESDVTVLVDGSNAANPSVNYDVSASEVVNLTATYAFASPGLSVSPMLNSTTEYFRVTGLSDGTTYRVDAISQLSNKVDLKLYSDALITNTCTAIMGASITCYSTPGASGEMYLEIGGVVLDTINIIVSPISTNSGTSVFDSSTPLEFNKIYYYEFVGLTMENAYVVDLITTPDQDFDLYVYSDRFTTQECASVNSATGSESCITSGGVSKVYVIIDTTNASDTADITLTFTPQ